MLYIDGFAEKKKTTESLLMNRAMTIEENNNTEFDYLQSLNPQQRLAVETIDGPLLVLAGAGTGKTRVLTTRIAHILNSRDVYPSNVLAVTFTNKAAQEMIGRLRSVSSGSTDGIWLGTFHSLALRILRRHAELVGLQPSFTILDSDDQLRLIKQLIRAESLDEKVYIPKVIASQISKYKDRGVLPQKITSAEIEALPIDFRANFSKLYTKYQERLSVMNVVDFGDLLLLCIELFKNNPEVLSRYQSQFKYILVDEYQDTNVSQYLWLRLLAQGYNNLCCVGDDDQSIYGWRGAEITNILRFEQDFTGASIIRLEENYRSTFHILGAASGLIEKNGSRLGKTLWTSKDGGELVAIRSLWDGAEEARFIGDEIEALHTKGEDLSSIAILVRASFQTREFEDRLIVLGVAYKVVGGARFYERQEIRDAIAYLRLISSFYDSMAFERIVNVPKRGVGDSTMQVLHSYARMQSISLWESCLQLFETDEIKGKAKLSLQSLIKDFERWHSKSKDLKPADLMKLVLDESGYNIMWLQDKSPDAAGRIENLKELVRAMGEYETLQDFLEHVSLVMDNNASGEEDKVSIMTVHAAKGLEFNSVFLAGWEEDIFPSAKSLKEKGVEGLEEERRLAYVGITRAKKRAFITYALNRRMYGGWQASLPSRFIEELPPQHVAHLKRSNFFNKDLQSKQRSVEEMSSARDARVSVESYQSSGQFKIGQRVFHIKFGYGKIVDIEGDKLEINFDHSGRKKVVASFLQTA
jgi:DNA helicase-2/ATP-dependent DNA helicase PcrA